MGILRVSRVVKASRTVAWKVVADVENYGDYAPNLSATHVTSGSGLGMKRTCSNLQGQSWSEECVLWDEGRRYSFRVDTSVYPYPIKALAGMWELDEVPQGTLIKMTFDYTMKYGVAGRGVGFVLRPWFKRVCTQLFDNWQAKIEADAAIEQSEPPDLHRICAARH